MASLKTATDFDKIIKELEQLSDSYFMAKGAHEKTSIKAQILRCCEINNMEPLILCPHCDQFSTENDYGCCNMCNEFKDIDVLLAKDVERGRESQLNGIRAEIFVANRLRKEGFKVARVWKYDEEKHQAIFDKVGVNQFLARYSGRGAIVNYLAEKLIGLPDLIALKGKEVSFIEVKYNESEIKLHQDEVLNDLANMGYEAYIKRVTTEDISGQSS